MNKDILKSYIPKESVAEPKDNFEHELLLALRRRIQKLERRRRVASIFAQLSLAMLVVALLIRYVKIDTLILIQALALVVVLSVVALIRYRYKIRKLKRQILEYTNNKKQQNKQ
ncbi:MAG: hypothetical protein R3Y61_00995 [Rikenellaceae bacterium]